MLENADKANVKQFKSQRVFLLLEALADPGPTIVLLPFPGWPRVSASAVKVKRQSNAPNGRDDRYERQTRIVWFMQGPYPNVQPRRDGPQLVHLRVVTRENPGHVAQHDEKAQEKQAPRGRREAIFGDLQVDNGSVQLMKRRGKVSVHGRWQGEGGKEGAGRWDGNVFLDFLLSCLFSCPTFWSRSPKGLLTRGFFSAKMTWKQDDVQTRACASVHMEGAKKKLYYTTHRPPRSVL